MATSLRKKEKAAFGHKTAVLDTSTSIVKKPLRSSGAKAKDVVKTKLKNKPDNQNARGEAQQRRITCAKCNEEKEKRFFPKQALRNEKRSLKRKTGLVCKACRGSKLCKTCCKCKETSKFRDGQEVCKGCQEIYCCGCGLSKAPGMFFVKHREYYFRKPSQQVACSECIKKGINARIGDFRKDAKCSECTKELPNKMFRRIKGQRQTKCKDCEEVSCQACGQERPGKSFDELTKMNYFSHGQTAVCYECIKSFVY